MKIKRHILLLLVFSCTFLVSFFPTETAAKYDAAGKQRFAAESESFSPTYFCLPAFEPDSQGKNAHSPKVFPLSLLHKILDPDKGSAPSLLHSDPMHEDTPLLQQKLEPSSNFSSFTKTAASIIASPLPSGTAKNTANDNFVMQIVELVNAERAAEGLQPLVLDSSLCSAAEIRAEEILKNFSHSRPDGSSCFSALQQAGVVYRRAGENIARGQQNPEEVMKDWMNSPGHRENILNNGYSRIGIALRKANRGYSWAQFFAD